MKTKGLTKIYSYLVMTLAAAFLAFPLLWLIITSFKTEVQLFEFPIRILPHPFTIQNYQDVIADGSMLVYMKNSLITALITTLITLVISIPAAYSLAKIKFPFSKVLLLIITIIRMLPSVTGILAMYQILNKINLIDTRVGLIIDYLPGSVVFMIILLRTFFEDFPKDLEDAGKIDGLNVCGIIIKLVIPIMIPAIYNGLIN